METIKLNVEAVNTHREKPTVSIFPQMNVQVPCHLQFLNLWHQDTGVSFMYKRKTDPELLSYIVSYFQTEKMLELFFFKISTSFMSLDLASWLLESQLNMESV